MNLRSRSLWSKSSRSSPAIRWFRLSRPTLLWLMKHISAKSRSERLPSITRQPGILNKSLRIRSMLPSQCRSSTRSTPHRRHSRVIRLRLLHSIIHRSGIATPPIPSSNPPRITASMVALHCRPRPALTGVAGSIIAKTSYAFARNAAEPRAVCWVPWQAALSATGLPIASVWAAR